MKIEHLTFYELIFLQVQDLTAQTLAAGGIDAAALLAKLPLAANMEAELHRHIEKMYEYDPETLHALQQEPMELTSGMVQGWHRLEKYLNLEGILEKSLKIKFALKSTEKSLKSLEKFVNSTIFCRIETIISIKLLCFYLVQHMLHQIKAQQFFTNSLVLISP